MKNRHLTGSLLSLLLALTLSAGVSARSVSEDSLKRSGRQTVGLVLSGGGAKGIAHAGVIKALEENDIPIDYVTGTSMGAIVGSLYSCGWSPEKMESFFTAPDFKYWSTGTIDKNLVYYISTPTPTPQWVSLNVNFRDTTNIVNQIIPANLISPIPMNLEFLKLYAPYTDQCRENFNNLFVPFRCVTSDVYHKRKIVLDKGSLGDAVRASMSFPLVFKPIKMDGVLVYDGGIYDNFPVDVMQKDFNPDFIIGVSVSSPDKKPREGDIYSQLEDMIIQNNNYSVPAENGIKIQVPVLNFGVLDFAKAPVIYEIGYRTGLAMVDSIKKRVRARRPLETVTRRRAEFASKTPDVRFDSVKVTGADREQGDYIAYLFRGKGGKPINMKEVENAYYRAVTDGTLSNLLPQAVFNRDGRNTLLLEASVKRPWRIGVGGWITSSTNSMLYLGLGFHTLSFNSLDLSVSGWLGQSYYAGMLTGKFALRTATPSYLQLEGVMSKQKYYDNELLFYETSTPTFITENDNFLRLNFVRAFGRRAKGYAGVGYGYMSDSYYPDNVTDYTSVGKDKTKYHIWAFRAGIDSSTLNEILYPSSGYEWSANVILSHESSRYYPGSSGMAPDAGFRGHGRGSLELKWKNFFPLHRHVNLGVSATALGTLQRITQNYTATLIHAPAFAPTPSTRNYFNQRFRSDNYVAVGLIPIWMPVSRLQVRGDFYAYSPMRHLVSRGSAPAAYKGWFKKADFIGEIAGVYNFPFASLSIYCNYLSYPANNWNFGINFGLLIQAPKFLR